MFVSLETGDFREVIRAQLSEKWNAMAIGFLQRNDRNVAVGKIAEALQFYAMEQPMPAHQMLATLYSLALRRVDYFTVALELVQSAETMDPTLVKDSAPEGEVSEEELLAA